MNHQQQQQLGNRIFITLMQKVGTAGKYQFITLLLWCIACYICGGFILITPYLFHQNSYSCKNQFIIQSCKEYVCQLPPSERFKYIPTRLFLSMTQEYGDFRFILFMYTSTIFAYVCLSFVGQKIKRKKSMIVGILFTIIGILWSIFANNIWLAAVGLFLGLSGAQWLFSVSFFFISQTFCEIYRQKAQIIVQMFYGLGSLANVAFYYWLQDWKKVFFYGYIIPAVILLVCVLFIVVDTPMSLIQQLQAQQVFEKLLWIARFNGTQNCKLTLQQVKQIKEMQIVYQINNAEEEKAQNSNKFNILDLCRYPSLRYMTLGLIILQCGIVFLFYAPQFMLSQLQLNLFINGLIIGGSHVLSYPISFFLIQSTQRKKTALVCFGIVCVCAIALCIIWRPYQKVDNMIIKVFELGLFFILTLSITIQYTFFYVYFNQLYATQVRLIGTSVVIVAGGVTTSLTSLILASTLQKGPLLMIIFSILALVCGIVSVFLPETYNLPPSDIIQQLSARKSTAATANISGMVRKNTNFSQSKMQDQDGRSGIEGGSERRLFKQDKMSRSLPIVAVSQSQQISQRFYESVIG